MMKRETRIGLGVGLLLILGFGLILSEITNSSSQPLQPAPDDDDTVYVAISRHVRPAGRSQTRIGEAVTPPPSYRRTTQRRSAPSTQPTPPPPQQRDRRVEAADVMLAATAGQRRQAATQADPPATRQGPPRPQFTEMDAQQLHAYVRSAASPATQVYVVKSGDTLTSIARRLMGDGSWATVRRLYEMNRNTLSDPDRLDVGMRLTVPGGRERDN